MNKGNVVEFDWPYTDFTGSKIRPAVVVQADYLNGVTKRIKKGTQLVF
jgi:hypothetical protein